MNLLQNVEQLEHDASEFGFRWETSAQIMEQIKSECHEISEHLFSSTQENRSALQEEIGDLLHAAFSLCVFCGFSPEETLKKTLNKFDRRLKMVKKITHEEQLTDLQEQSFNELMRIWKLAKSRTA